MNRQLGKTREWLSRPKQSRGAILANHMASKIQVSIEPRIQQWRSVHLHFERAEIALGRLGAGLQVQARRIGMSTDDSETIVGPNRRNEGNQSATARDETLYYASGEVRKLAAFIEPYKTSIEQMTSSSGDYVMGCRGLIEEAAEVGNARLSHLAGTGFRP